MTDTNPASAAATILATLESRLRVLEAAPVPPADRLVVGMPDGSMLLVECKATNGWRLGLYPATPNAPALYTVPVSSRRSAEAMRARLDQQLVARGASTRLEVMRQEVALDRAKTGLRRSLAHVREALAS